MTTGDPGTQAQVTNSGTERDAVFDFTIPQGKNGSGGGSVDLLSAYSIPPQAASSGAPILFDLNALTYGSSISHTARSGDFVISQPGVYAVSFFGNISPASGVTFPLSITLQLQQNGTAIPEGGALHVFHTSTENISQAISIPIAVSSTPTTIRLVTSGGNIFYTGVTMTIYRLGDIPMA